MPGLPFKAQAGPPRGWDTGTAVSRGHPTRRPGVPARREGARFKAWLETSSPKAQQDGEAGPCTPSWQGLSRLCVGGTARCVCPSVCPGLHRPGNTGAWVLRTLGAIQHGWEGRGRPGVPGWCLCLGQSVGWGWGWRVGVEVEDGHWEWG